MNVEKFNYLGYDIELIYQPFFDDSKPKSKQYKLVIKKDKFELINCYGLTRSAAISYSKSWINKQSKKDN